MTGVIVRGVLTGPSQELARIRRFHSELGRLIDRYGWIWTPDPAVQQALVEIEEIEPELPKVAGNWREKIRTTVDRKDR